MEDLASFGEEDAGFYAEFLTVKQGSGLKRDGTPDLTVRLLIHEHRDADKKAQDALYIHDTLELFGASLDKLRTVWEGEVRPDDVTKDGEEGARDCIGTI
jgi:hypothetical protein